MSKVYKVSSKWLSELLMYLEEGYCTIPLSIYGLNLTNDKSFEVLVKEHILPTFLTDSISRQFYIKSSLQYGLNYWSEEKLESTFENMDLVLEKPKEMTAKEFYGKIWNLMFPNENFHLIDTSVFTE